MRSLLLTLVAAIGLIVCSCINDDIDSSPSARLQFSTDTLSFGTVFTDQGSVTARLLVFNRNKKGVNISSIRFKDPDTPFSLNVDGTSGETFHDVEIRGNDSIYIFIECFLPAGESVEPLKFSDRLEFITNGNTQEVEVEAWAQNVVRLNGMRIEQDMTFTSTLPYLITDSLSVEKDAVLRIEPGASLLFHDKAFLSVRGRIEAIGETGKMISLRGDRIDNVLPDVGYDILAGQWKGVRIAPESFGNRLEFVDMRSTEEGLRIDSCSDLSRQKLTIVNSWLHNSQTSVIESKYAKVDAYGCCFSESPRAVVSLTGGEHRFVQCTIANNYLFSAVTEPNLSLYHCLPEDSEENGLPLMKASFENSIVYGIGKTVNTGNLEGSQVYFRNVLLKEKGSDDDYFINCLWDEDPLFYTVRADYYFNYRLMPDSPAIGKGDPAFVTEQCLFDMDGLNRLSEGFPALGAYVFEPPKEE